MLRGIVIHHQQNIVHELMLGVVWLHYTFIIDNKKLQESFIT